MFISPKKFLFLNLTSIQSILETLQITPCYMELTLKIAALESIMMPIEEQGDRGTYL